MALPNHEMEIDHKTRDGVKKLESRRWRTAAEARIAYLRAEISEHKIAIHKLLECVFSLEIVII